MMNKLHPEPFHVRNRKGVIFRFFAFLMMAICPCIAHTGVKNCIFHPPLSFFSIPFPREGVVG